MNLEHLANDGGLEDVALQLLHQKHNTEDDQRGNPAVREQSDDGREDSGRDGTDDRDKCGEEDQHRER